MASLREIKDRIGSVRSTLKITSAMKLVASAKLRKAQRAIEGMRPYERPLAEILAAVGPQAGLNGPARPLPADGAAPGKTAVVAISSNSSLCGGFNANVARKALEAIRSCGGGVEVYPVGRKVTDALRRAGYVASEDYNELVAHPAYGTAAQLADTLCARFRSGELSRVLLVYNHFVSAASQVPVCEQYLPFEAAPQPEETAAPGTDYLVEPDAAQLVAQLLPQVLMLRFYAAILDSAAAEHAARTLAMQTASDNAEDLLAQLTLEYNKGRQQKITAEILDLLGGSADQ